MVNCVGRKLGKYHIVRFLGKGGFGDVYLGEHVEDGTQTAIKVLRKPLTNENIKEFVNEAGLRQLRHEHIVRLLDFGIGEDHIPFLVMEYAPNGSLADCHPRGTRLPLDTITSYVKPLSAALQYAHDRGLIHRDIKPANFLIGTNGKVLLSDFGIAAIALSTHSREQRDEKQQVVGSWVYTAPEQFIGKAVRASDQYSLAVVVYAWLCGSLPFIADAPSQEEQFLQLAYQHKQIPPPPLHEKMSISPALEKVIMRALAKEPEQRFESVKAFADDLVACSVADPHSRPQPKIPEPPERTPHAAQRDNIPGNGQTHLFERLWRESLQALTRGENELAFRLLRKSLMIQNLTSSQRDLVKSQIRSLRQMIPLGIQRARKASTQGHWQEEIQAWEDLLILDPSREEITGQLTFSPGWDKESVIQSIQERLDIARRNEQCAWMYTQAQQFISDQHNAVAYKQLETLWREARFYGDPAGLAQILGLPPARNYEQALTEEQARQQREREAAERERQKQQQREAAEREHQKQRQREADELARQEKRRRAIAAGISGGTGVGCLAGVLLAGIWYTFAPPQRIPEQEALGHSLVSGLERVFIFFAIFPQWVSVIIAGVLAGLTVGAVVGCIRSIINPSCYSSGTIAGGIVGFFAGLVVLGIAGSLIGGFIGAALCVAFGPWLGMYVGAEMGASIGGKWEYRKEKYYR